MSTLAQYLGVKHPKINPACFHYVDHTQYRCELKKQNTNNVNPSNSEWKHHEKCLSWSLNSNSQMPIKHFFCSGIKLGYIGYFIYHCQLASGKANEKKGNVIALRIGIHPSSFSPQSFLHILTFFPVIPTRLHAVARSRSSDSWLSRPASIS